MKASSTSKIVRGFLSSLAIFAASAALAAGCGDDTSGQSTTTTTTTTTTATGAGGATATGTGGGTGAVGGGGSGSGGGDCNASCDACKACAVDGACAAALASCSANPECGELSGCVAVCGQTTACVASCAAQHAIGIADYQALATCLFCDECTSCTGCDTLGCIDGIQNGTETALDCGGGECAGCADGNPCANDGDCVAAHCVELLCCDTACNGVCQACSGALTGMADGSCAPLLAGTDPLDECKDADVCNGQGACQCDDGIVNGAEVAVDCGGGTCDGCDNGSPCSKGSDCLSFNCVDSVCCDMACEGGCEACSAAAKGGGADGVCGPIGNGLDPDAECNSPAPDVCNGSGSCRCADGVQNFGETGIDCGGPCVVPCNGTCFDGILNNGESDVDCGGMNCMANCANGKICDFGSDCQSTFCVEGLCCNTACSGTCVACSAAKTDSPDGTCGPVTDNTDPDNECSNLPPCGTDGACNGGGACGFYPAGGSCGDLLSCSGTTQTNADVCSGNGACTEGGITPCPPYACGAQSCKTSCAGDGDCSSGNYCAAPACVPKKANGAMCGGANQCQSGFCTDGVCCNVACTGNTCNACTVAKKGQGVDGTCGTIVAGQDPDNECNPGACNGAGVCQCADGSKNGTETDVDCGGICNKCAQGKVCLVGGDCTTTFCADGFCCNTACSQLCAACSQAKSGAANGTCDLVDVGGDPDSECNNPVADICNGAGVCRCFDNVKNGTESDIDCGGASCNKCASGKLCGSGTDCQTGSCIGGVCCNELTCGGNSTCSGGECSCLGSFLDCDGFWGNGCETNGLNNNSHCGGCGNTCSGSRFECCGGVCHDLCNANECVECGFGCNGSEPCYGGVPGNPQCGSPCPCTSPDTPIATPTGDRAIADLAPGDLVYSVHEGAIVAVPVLRKNEIPVVDHRVMRVVLEGGRVLEITPGHPTADGRTFADLAPGATLGGVGVVEAELVSYRHPSTFDILPASDTGTYFAAGALVASTMHAPVKIDP